MSYVLYKHKTYRVKWSGRTRTGKDMHRLQFMDGSKEFWADSHLCTSVDAPSPNRRKTPKRSGPTKVCWECGGEFDYAFAKENDGDYAGGHCGC